MTMIQETSKHKRDLHETVLAALHVQTRPEKVLARSTHGKGTTPTGNNATLAIIQELLEAHLYFFSRKYAKQVISTIYCGF